MRKQLQQVFLYLFLINVRRAFGEVTPEVSIMEESPPHDSNRIIKYTNGTIEIQGLIGENVVLECQVFNKAAGATIMWKRTVGSSTELISDDFRTRDQSKWKIGQGKQQDSVRLEIMSLSTNYEGIYTCECRYSGSIAPAKAIRDIRVFQKPIMVLYKSSFDQTVKLGDKAVLTCETFAIPPATITWRRVGGDSSVIRNFGLEKAGTDIVLEETIESDAGIYLCKAENRFGYIEWKVDLSIRHQPVINLYPSNGIVAQKVGCNFELICAVKSVPAVSTDGITWSYTGGDLTKNSRMTVKNLVMANQNIFSYLRIQPLADEDLNKKFTCTAANDMGTSSDFAIIRASSTEMMGGYLTCHAHGSFGLTNSLALIGCVIVSTLCTFFHLF